MHQRSYVNAPWIANTRTHLDIFIAPFEVLAKSLLSNLNDALAAKEQGRQMSNDIRLHHSAISVMSFRPVWKGEGRSRTAPTMVANQGWNNVNVKVFIAVVRFRPCSFFKELMRWDNPIPLPPVLMVAAPLNSDKKYTRGKNRTEKDEKGPGEMLVDWMMEDDYSRLKERTKQREEWRYSRCTNLPKGKQL